MLYSCGGSPFIFGVFERVDHGSLELVERDHVGATTLPGAVNRAQDDALKPAQAHKLRLDKCGLTKPITALLIHHDRAFVLAEWQSHLAQDQLCENARTQLSRALKHRVPDPCIVNQPLKRH